VLDDFRRLEMVTSETRRTAAQRWRVDKGHAGLWQAFLQAIETGGQPPVAYLELFGVAHATLAAADSLRSGAAVELDLSGYDPDAKGGRGLPQPPFAG
jgi:hypothetical protein